AEVPLHKSGSFAFVVPLKEGINEFKITSYPSPLPSSYGTPHPNPLPQGERENNYNKIISARGEGEINPVSIDFIIERPKPQTTKKIEPILLEYPPMNNFFIKDDNTPLRLTPFDSGINRMAHLQKETPLVINGEKGGFWRVFLNSKTIGWILKSDVEQKTDSTISALPVSIKKLETKETKDFCIWEFELEGKTPFVLKEEDNRLNLKLFNVKSEDKNLCIEDSSLNFDVPVKKLFGYDAYFEGNKFILKVRKAPEKNCDMPLKGLTITVDAGHGGAEYGAIGPKGDKEKDINLEIAKNLKAELETLGAKVIMTRKDDIAVSLKDRVKTARENDSVILISIHANALPDGADPIKCRGTSVYYYHNQAKPLADSILNSIITKSGTQNDRMRQGSLALVRPTSSVSVLVEVAYIINPDDCELLLDKEFQKNCAKAITEGVVKYLSD
ncbi:MAG TPA: N-acetylmuramoyl-L-alanine amidase, partial [Candidatus Gastranaerophilaceae bacterium]|nr:N-acetylmuramoyl-L-alanine amidase [Candidatus Gastranaerophilaceae bacterium]